MKLTLLAAGIAAITPAWAQPQAIAPSTNPAVPQIVITANPLGRGDVATPSTVLAGDGLVLRRASTLGETLDGLPGVSSSTFGPNASRPVIRGQDGDRIRVLSNSGASVDASSLSFDHAVPIDPLVVERIEVLRGPVALLYGGSAVGGVVNAIDNRIPKTRVEQLTGAVETRVGGASNERALSALVEGGTGGLVFHADAFGRRTDDLRVPAFYRPLDDGSSERRTRIVNSASHAQGGALGGSWVSDQGYLGASIDSYRNNYGIVTEEDVTIRMRRDKVALAGEVRSPAGMLSGFFTTLRGQASSTDYEHQEVEGSGSVGTTFKSRGSDARLQANHRAFSLGAGRLEGTWGVQWESTRFSALGAEAFVPSTRTAQTALFALERWSWADASHLSAGLRAERVRVNSDGDSEPAAAQFGSAQARSFSPRSASVGAVVNITSEWNLTANLAATERAPTNYELYANGLHAATGAYEKGDTTQGLERGRNVDLALAWRSGGQHLRLSVFDSRFANYILLSATGAEHVDDEGNRSPVYSFQGVRARLHGFEAEGSWQLLKGATRLALDGTVDWVRGSNLDTGEPLPRLAPLRTTVGLEIGRAAWAARVEVQHARDQNRVPRTDAPTAGWTMVNLSARYHLPLAQRDVLLFLKLQNAGNVLAYSASTTGNVRSLAPMPGRALSAGVRFAF